MRLLNDNRLGLKFDLNCTRSGYFCDNHKVVQASYLCMARPMSIELGQVMQVYSEDLGYVVGTVEASDLPKLFKVSSATVRHYIKQNRDQGRVICVCVRPFLKTLKYEQMPSD